MSAGRRSGAVELEAVGVASRYPEPTADIDPDRELGWLRRIRPIIGAERRTIGIGVVTGVLALASQVAVPAVAANAIDAATEDDRTALTTAVAAMLVLAVVRFATGATYRYSLFRAAYAVDATLRNLLYRHLMRLSFSYYDRTQTGDVISRANSDLRSIQLYLAFGPLVLLSSLTFVFAFTYMLTINVSLTLVAVATLPGVYVLGVRMRNQVFPLSWITAARQADVATIVDENVNGIRVVKSFAAEERQIEDLARSARRLRWSSVETIKSRARYNPLIEALPRIGMAMVLLYGGWLAIEGEVTIGTLFAFNAYVIMLQAPFRLLGFLLLQGQRAKAAAHRVLAVLDEEPELADRPGAADLVDPAGRIEFRSVRFAYPTRRTGATGDRDADDNAGDDTGETAAGPWDADGDTGDTDADDAPVDVLRGFDLTIEPGETVTIVGATGSGKSTVARLLARFYDPDSGSVLIDGHDVRDLTMVSVRHHVGMVLDEPFLFSSSIHDNIAFTRPDATRADVIAAAEAAQAGEFIQRLDDAHDTVVGERGYTLSGGQRQRIAIARTLLADPTILVLDDATSAIDVTVEAAIHASLDRVIGPRTTILIAHRLSTIALADRVVMIEDGRVAATGSHRELLATEPRYVEILADAGASDAEEAA